MILEMLGLFYVNNTKLFGLYSKLPPPEYRMTLC